MLAIVSVSFGPQSCPSPSPPTSPSSLSHWNSENWQKFEKNNFFFLIFQTSFQNIYQSLCTQGNICLSNTFFNCFVLFMIFWIFLKSPNLSTIPQPNFTKWSWILRIFQQYSTSEPCWKILRKKIFWLQVACGFVLKLNFPKTWLLTNWRFH